MAAQLDRILAMPEALLTCRGFPLGGAIVPSFEVMRGQIVTVQLPPRFDSTAQLAAALAGVLRRPEVALRGRGVSVEPAEPPVGWRRWLSDPSPGEWLARQGFAADEAAAVLSRHRIDDRFRLSQYAKGPRSALGLEAALRSRPDVVIFNTSGLDPRWELAVQDLIRSSLDRTAAVYLATPFLSNGAICRRTMPGEVVVEVSPHTPASV